jgi:hypothetical protein
MVVQNLEIHADLWFKKFEFFFLPYEKKFLLINFLLNNLEYFLTNSAVYSIHTQHKYNNNSPLNMLSCLQKSAYCAGIKIFKFSTVSKTTRIRNDILKWH